MALVKADGPKKIKIWADSTRKNAPESLVWDFSKNQSPPEALWVEGLKKSATLRDVRLDLTYNGPTNGVDSAFATVDDIDLDAISPKNISGKLIPEKNEMDPGLFLMVNDDFDGELKDSQGNPLPDNSDDKINGKKDKKDMANLMLRKLMKNLPAGGKVFIKKMNQSGDGEVRIFETDSTVLLDTSKHTSIDETKAKAIFTALKTGKLAYWMEGLESGTLTIVMEYKLANGETVGSDEIKVTVLKVDLISTDLDGTLEECKEETPGAYIHFNIDKMKK